MDIKVRFTILGLIFVLSTVFFWQALNDRLVPSKAQQEPNFKVLISDQDLQCNPGGLCLVHIFGSSEKIGVAGVQGGMQYADELQPVGLTQEGFCAQTSFDLDQTLRYNSDTVGKKVSFAVGALRRDDQLQTGARCITTVGFQPQNVSDGQTTTVSLLPSTEWQAIGASQLVTAADTNAVTITFSDSAPIPTITITPPAGGNPGSGCAKSDKADCNCDDAIDLVDWEMLRSAIRGESQSCDPNNDGTVNALDISLWKTHNELLQGEQRITN